MAYDRIIIPHVTTIGVEGYHWIVYCVFPVNLAVLLIIRLRLYSVLVFMSLNDLVRNITQYPLSP